MMNELSIGTKLGLGVFFFFNLIIVLVLIYVITKGVKK